MTTNPRLFNRNFFLLWQGQLVSQLGTQAVTIATMMWVKHATESATVMGGIMMASLLPLVLLSPVGGTLADRVSRKRIIVTCDVVNGIASLSLGALMLAMPDATAFLLGWLVMVAVTGGIAQAFFMPAIAAAIPNLVPPERLESANSLSEGSVQLATLVGQSVGGLLFRILGAPVLFIVDGITFLFSATSESFIAIPQELPEKAETWRGAVEKFKSELREGLAFVWQHRGMRSLLLVAATMNFFAMPFLVLLPFFVEDTLGLGADWFGYLLASLGGGALIGYIIAGSVPVGRSARAAMMILSLFLLSTSLVVLGYVRSGPAALGVLAAAGVFQGIFNIHVMTILQKTTPDAYRGRVFGLFHTLVLGVSPISLGVTGVVADLLDRNAPLMFIVCGAVLIVTTLVSTLSRDYRNYLASDYGDTPEDASSV